MFNMLTNLTKAAVAVAVTPVAVVADLVTLPASSCDLNRGAFDKTASVLNAAKAAFTVAVEPEEK
jgi:hypothetical protein